MATVTTKRTTSSGSVREETATVLDTYVGNLAAVAGLSVQIVKSGYFYTLIFTLSNVAVTLVKNGTTSGGGGTLLFTFRKGLIQQLGGTSNLTVANALDKSFVASVGSAAAGTDGTLTGTEISFTPSTTATTSSGAGTCKMKTATTATTPLDGTSTRVPVYLNSALNADATGAEALTYSGTITLCVVHYGDNG